MTSKIAKLVKDCQDALADWIVPDSRMTDEDVLNTLLSKLDSNQSREALREEAGRETEIARLREDAANWKRAAEYQYLQLRIAKYGPDEKTYPVDGALDAWFNKTYVAIGAARGEP